MTLFSAPTKKRTRSEAIFKTHCNLIPGGVNSPVRAFHSVEMTPPLIVVSGSGDTIEDVDGNRYIDYCGSWGAMILGHAHPQVVKGVQERMALGSSFGITTVEEGLLAQKIVKKIPSIEKIRFVSSGTEATMTALRLARGYTGRSKVIKFTGHYHGHSDALLVQAGSGVATLNSTATSKGVHAHIVQDTLCFPFNDFEKIRSFFKTPLSKEVAAIILEPIAGNMGTVLPDRGFLEMLREETTKAGALLIFDEVITGFRVGPKGAQGLYPVDPDLTCFGKIIGGGFPVAAVAGKAKIMDYLAPLGQVYQAGTLSGNPVAMRAGLETLLQLEAPHFYETLQKKTDRLLNPIREAVQVSGGCLQECGSMFSIFFGLSQVKSKEDLVSLNKKRFRELFSYLFDRGIYIPPSSQEAWFVSSAHTDEHLDYTAKSVCSFLSSL